MTRFQRQRKRLMTAIVVLSILLFCLSGVAYAKYTTSKSAGAGQIQLTANIGTVQLWETPHTFHKTNGFVPGAAPALASNATYPIIPGLDIPKDTYVRVQKENPIEVYVYLILDTNITAQDTGIRYALAEHWRPVAENVYVYEDAITAGMDIPILENHSIFVSQYVNQNVTGSVYLDFSAVMYQTAAGQTPEQVYAYYNHP